jgi:hypothetical protein
MAREWRRKPLKSLKTDSEMGDPPARGRWEVESIRRMPYMFRGPSSSQFRAQPFQIRIAHADLPEVIVGL